MNLADMVYVFDDDEEIESESKKEELSSVDEK